ncbi:GerMN domain-containing protein [Aphanothece sacrum]|uniref:Lipoprotein LpqB n=1 Tax=Aphanothece sacrum FPU1 TaxID=1920663 RepID=A0A401ICZ8_APHSA|nr:GerMN domain-containing protein [Aphanothece sacrum]GBF79116.1 lipoprotein LpqB [Aphanothece sacrum FPU1]GBF85163.1 lipoprotein LpqB, GerMN domain-containing protein [Aphanothece sacrum FPU3]
MQNNQNRSSIGFIAGLITAVIVTGSLSTWWAVHTLTTSQTKPSTPTETPIPQTPKQVQAVVVYWLNDRGERLKLLNRPIMVNKSSGTQITLKTALETLLAGSKDFQYSSAIPSGTKLLSLIVDKQGVHLNLSSEFTRGGGSASMTGRLAQLLYTATSIDPKTQVWLSVEGQPLEVLGGEGLEIQQPMTRKWFDENFEL